MEYWSDGVLGDERQKAYSESWRLLRDRARVRERAGFLALFCGGGRGGFMEDRMGTNVKRGEVGRRDFFLRQPGLRENFRNISEAISGDQSYLQHGSPRQRARASADV